MDRAEGTLGITRRKLLELRSEMAAIRLRLALRAFDPNQPRWPAGRTDGGQWRPASRGNATRVAAFEEGRRMQCDLQRELDEELCAMQLGSLAAGAGIRCRALEQLHAGRIHTAA